MKYIEATKKCSQLWNEMSEEEASTYYSMSQKDYYRFLRETKELKDTGGFTDEFGVHSSKMVPKIKHVPAS